MMQHPDFEHTDLSRLRIAGVGGAPCALTILEVWAARGVPMLLGFGMTETSPAHIFLDVNESLRKIGSTGKTLLRTETHIVNDEGGDCAPNEISELWVAGPNITPGYWNRPDATAAAFENRWLKTGNAARMDDEVHFSIGRLQQTSEHVRQIQCAGKTNKPESEGNSELPEESTCPV